MTGLCNYIITTQTKGIRPVFRKELEASGSFAPKKPSCKCHFSLQQKRAHRISTHCLRIVMFHKLAWEAINRTSSELTIPVGETEGGPHVDWCNSLIARRRYLCSNSSWPSSYVPLAVMKFTLISSSLGQT